MLFDQQMLFTCFFFPIKPTIIFHHHHLNLHLTINTLSRPLRQVHQSHKPNPQPHDQTQHSPSQPNPPRLAVFIPRNLEHLFILLQLRNHRHRSKFHRPGNHHQNSHDSRAVLSGHAVGVGLVGVAEEEESCDDEGDEAEAYGYVDQEAGRAPFGAEWWGGRLATGVERDMGYGGGEGGAEPGRGEGDAGRKGAAGEEADVVVDSGVGELVDYPGWGGEGDEG
uniref:Uncharacterized protein n=1 Tax=Podospora anserina (strain S / ATCC MYA-4624 / DSM 980 / FGSC 10383) TaxID=515849 RepID=A0A090CIB3_PODAN|nr:Putative protein of unknown function [Podospora anserina S mat+]